MSDANPLIKLSGRYGVRWWCFGCECFHLVPAKQLGASHADRPGSGVNDGWDFNEDWDCPTLSPSVLVFGHKPDENSVAGYVGTPRCHTFIVSGQIQYLGDCEHEFAGRTVDMLPVSKWHAPRVMVRDPYGGPPRLPEEFYND